MTSTTKKTASRVSFNATSKATATATRAIVAAVEKAVTTANGHAGSYVAATSQIATLAAQVAATSPALRGMTFEHYQKEVAGLVKGALAKLQGLDGKPVKPSTVANYATRVQALVLAATHGMPIPAGSQSQAVTAINAKLRAAKVVPASQGGRPARPPVKATGGAADAKAASTAKAASKGNAAVTVTYEAMRDAAFIVAAKDERRAALLTWAATHHVKEFDAFLSQYAKEANV